MWLGSDMVTDVVHAVSFDDDGNGGLRTGATQTAAAPYGSPTNFAVYSLDASGALTSRSDSSRLVVVPDQPPAAKHAVARERPSL